MESLQEVDGGHTDTLYGAAVDFKPVPGCTGGRDRNWDNRYKEYLLYRGADTADRRKHHYNGCTGCKLYGSEWGRSRLERTCISVHRAG